MPQTTSDDITRSTRPSQFFSLTLKNMGRHGYEAIYLSRTYIHLGSGVEVIFELGMINLGALSRYVMMMSAINNYHH